jgi:hypothetical protein
MKEDEHENDYEVEDVKRLMGLKVHQDGVKPTYPLE